MTGQRPSRTLSKRKSSEWICRLVDGLTSSCVRMIFNTVIFVWFLHFRLDCPIQCLCKTRVHFFWGFIATGDICFWGPIATGGICFWGSIASGGYCYWGYFLPRVLLTLRVIAVEGISFRGLLVTKSVCISGRSLLRVFVCLGFRALLGLRVSWDPMAVLGVWEKQDRFRGCLGDEVAIATKPHPGQLIWQWREESKTFWWTWARGLLFSWDSAVWRFLLDEWFCSRGGAYEESCLFIHLKRWIGGTVYL